MKKNYLFVVLVLLVSGFVGCSDDDDSYDWRKVFEKEQANIANFVKDKNPKVFTYHYTYKNEAVTDYAYVFDYAATGTTAKSGEFVWVNYKQKSLINEALIDATDLSAAVGAGIIPSSTLGGPILMQINPDLEKYTDPLSDLLMCIPEGTSGNTIISSIMSLANYYIYREYKIERIVAEKNLLKYEESLIDNYLDTVAGLNPANIIEFTSDETIVNNDTIAKIAKFELGTGDAITATDSVTIWLEGNILDAFGTSRRFLKMGENEESVKESVSSLKPDALRVAVLKLKVGDEAQILLPSGMGYGYRGGYVSGYCMIPSYSTLLYTVKIIDRKENPKKD